MLSIVIPCRNDQEVLNGTIQSIDDTIDLESYEYEIIVVDDGSKIPIEVNPVWNAKVIRTEPIGVGHAFDVGVEAARFDAIMLCGSDIRFVENGWATGGVVNLALNPKTLWCTACVGYDEEDDSFNDTRRYGANFIFFAERSDFPKESKLPKDHRMALVSKWIKEHDLYCPEVPVVLGACYFIRKEWYEHLQGFKNHLGWGTLDSYLSLKSWFAGGYCRCDTDTETGHIFDRPSPKSEKNFLYNKLMVANSILPEEIAVKVDEWISPHKDIVRAKKLYKQMEPLILKDREYYKSIFTRDYYWFKDKFGLK